MKRKIESETETVHKPVIKVFQVEHKTSLGGGAEDCEYTPETICDKFKRVVIIKSNKIIPSYIN